MAIINGVDEKTRKDARIKLKESNKAMVSVKKLARRKKKKHDK